MVFISLGPVAGFPVLDHHGSHHTGPGRVSIWMRNHWKRRMKIINQWNVMENNDIYIYIYVYYIYMIYIYICIIIYIYI